MKIIPLLTVSLIGIGTSLTPAAAHAQSVTLSQARRGFKSVVEAQAGPRDTVAKAPASVFRTITYPAAKGAFAAYVTPDPGDSKKHPAIVWITGGDCNSIGDVWTPAPRENDQTGTAFRKAGIVMMFPSLRGGNTNAGAKEGFLGEVDDVLAAAKYLATLPYVDPNRIYLGGHSTGGTLALLVAESSPRFRAVFSFGPVASVDSYGRDSGFLPFDTTNRKEVIIRSPGYWLSSVRSPTWVIEGTEGSSNAEALQVMSEISKNPRLRFLKVPGRDHFSVLAPVQEILARKIRADTGATSRISLTKADLAATKKRS